jgi:hypothetical protein
MHGVQAFVWARCRHAERQLVRNHSCVNCVLPSRFTCNTIAQPSSTSTCGNAEMTKGISQKSSFPYSSH